jgi:sec-independent protein translocase protein TatC
MASALDEDTVRTVQSGRATIGAMLSTAQTHLQKVFIVFVVGMIGTILALQYGVWDRLRQDLLYSKMDLTTQQATSIVAVTPFDVILLQLKIGVIFGVLVSLPLVIWFGRDALRARDLWPSDQIPRWKVYGVLVLVAGLFAIGVSYAYELFFPLMFDFLAGNADSAGFLPKYSIVMWFQFVALLATSFGLAAQLPLVMSVLSSSPTSTSMYSAWAKFNSAVTCRFPELVRWIVSPDMLSLLPLLRLIPSSVFRGRCTVTL